MIKIDRTGEIMLNGRRVGYVMQVKGIAAKMGKWRAEVGDPAKPETYRVVYARTRQEAVEAALKPDEAAELADRFGEPSEKS